MDLSPPFGALLLKKNAPGDKEAVSGHKGHWPSVQGHGRGAASSPCSQSRRGRHLGKPFLKPPPLHLRECNRHVDF